MLEGKTDMLEHLKQLLLKVLELIWTRGNSSPPKFVGWFRAKDSVRKTHTDGGCRFQVTK